MSPISKLIPIFVVAANAAIYSVAPPSAFQGPQSGIGSWFQTDAASSYTNGNSWCGYPYNDTEPLFAPSLSLMGGATYNSNPTAWRQQTREYCGREIKATNPANGLSKLLYIGDSFTSPRSSGSIDIVLNGFITLYGSNPNGNHNDVMNPVTWQLTGNVNTDYTAPGAVFPTAGGGTPQRTPTTATTPTTPAGLGAKCGLTVACQSPYTCLSPSGICSSAACNWGCTGWDCSSSSPCQLPNACVSGVCRASS